MAAGHLSLIDPKATIANVSFEQVQCVVDSWE